MSDPLFYAAAIPAVILTGISKGGLGLAGGLAVPIMALATSPMQAAAIMLPILCVMDLLGLYACRESWDRRNMKIILPAGILGLVLTLDLSVAEAFRIDVVYWVGDLLKTTLVALVAAEVHRAFPRLLTTRR